MNFFNNNKEKNSGNIFSIPRAPEVTKINLNMFRSRKARLLRSYSYLALSIMLVMAPLMPSIGNMNVFADDPGQFTGSISGTVVDDQGNPKADWSVVALGFMDNRNELSRVAKTDANGEYTFSELPTGDYIVCEVSIWGWDAQSPDGGCYGPVYEDDTWDSVVKIDTDGQQVTGKDFTVFDNPEWDDWDAPQLTVITSLLNNNGGTAEHTDFSVIVTGDLIDEDGSETGGIYFEDAPGPPGANVAVQEGGSYNVDISPKTTEAGDAYTSSKTAECFGTGMQNGDHKICVVTQKDILATCTLKEDQHDYIVTFPEWHHFDYLVAGPEDGDPNSPRMEEYMERNSKGPYSLETPIPAGNYDITLVSYDDHYKKLDQTQPEEQWFMQAHNASSDIFFDSSVIGDLPQEEDWLVEKVDNSATVSEDIHSVSVKHKLDFDPNNNPNSVDPVCIGFNEVDVPQEDEPNITLTKSAHPTSVDPGENTTYTLNVANIGSADAENVVLNDSLPDGLVFADDGTTEKEWQVGNMSPSTSKSIHYEVTVEDETTAGEYVNTAIATADNHDPVTATFSLEVNSETLPGQTEEPVLEVEKTSDRATYNMGENVVYTIDVTNTGSVQADNVTVLDILPQGFAWTETGESTITATLSSLDPGETWSESFVVNTENTLEPGHYSNLVKVTADNMSGESTAEHTIELVKGEVLGATGITPRVMALWALALALFGYSLYKIRKLRNVELAPMPAV